MSHEQTEELCIGSVTAGHLIHHKWSLAIWRLLAYGLLTRQLVRMKQTATVCTFYSCEKSAATNWNYE